MNNWDGIDDWEAWLIKYEADEDGYEDSDGYDFASIPDQVIMGLIDGYDDGHIDAVVFELLRYRKEERERTGAPEPPACDSCEHPGCQHMRSMSERSQ